MRPLSLFVFCSLLHTFSLFGLPLGPSPVYTESCSQQISLLPQPSPSPLWTLHRYLCLPANCNLQIGYYGDFVFNRYLALQGEGLGTGKVIRETRLWTNAAYLACSLWNYVDLFGTLGATSLSLTTNASSWINVSSLLVNTRLESETRLSWSGGARATIYRWQCLHLEGEGQYFQSNARFARCFSTYLIPSNLISFTHAPSVTYREWQLGCILSYHLQSCYSNTQVVPYLGIKWSHAQLTTHNWQFTSPNLPNNPFTIFDLHSHKIGGYAVGLNLSLIQTVELTLEGRWGDEQAFFLLGQWHF